jgi:hypothetical protein
MDLTLTEGLCIQFCMMVVISPKNYYSQFPVMVAQSSLVIPVHIYKMSKIHFNITLPYKTKFCKSCQTIYPVDWGSMARGL